MSVSTTYQKNSRIGNVFTKTKKAHLTTAEISKKIGGMDEAEARHIPNSTATS
jgi:hypothetical protein